MLKRVLKVGVLCSSRAPGLAEILAHPDRGRRWEIACVVSTETTMRDRDVIRAAGVPFLTHSIREFLAERKASLSDRTSRSEYDLATGRLLREMGVDAVVLLGYLYILHPAFLALFPSRVINVHDSDLTDVTASGEPRFVGLRSTRDAIVAGVAETRSSVHVVTEKLDAGPVVALSDPHPVSPFVREAAAAGHDDIVRAYAYAQREWMMRSSWGAMVAATLERLAGGEVLGADAGLRVLPGRVERTWAAAVSTQ